jgi:hypothetical protein
MSADAETHRDLRRRLFIELSRGADAELGALVKAIGVVAEPPAHLDAQILLESHGDGSQQLEPPPWVDKAILSAAEAAIRERTRKAAAPVRRTWRSGRGATVATFAMAAAVVLAVGLTRLRGHDRGLATHGPSPIDNPADLRIRTAVRDLTRDVLARDGREAAARVRSAEDPEGSGSHAPSWDELSRSRPSDEVDSTAPLSPADQERFAQGVLAAGDRARLASGPGVLPALQVMLERGRGSCPRSSRCFGLLSLGLARYALDGGDLARARAYADEALQVNDPEVRDGAREVMAELTRGG